MVVMETILNHYSIYFKIVTILVNTKHPHTEILSLFWIKVIKN